MPLEPPPPSDRAPTGASELSDLHGETKTSPPGPVRHRAPTGRVALKKGARVGRYEILDELGVGGMGVVYRARDHELDRDVALKLVTAAATEGESRGRARLLREAHALAQLAHPNVIAIFDVGRYEGAPPLAQEAEIIFCPYSYLIDPGASPARSAPSPLASPRLNVRAQPGPQAFARRWRLTSMTTS